MVRVLNIIFFFLNLILVGALFLSYSAAYINPDLFYIPAFFGLAYPFICLANILVMIWWIVQLKFKFLFSLSALIIGWGFVGKNVQLHKKENKDSSALKIMSYNVANFGFEENTKTWADILKLVTDEQPDILCLQEYCTSVNWRVNLERTFAEAMNTEHYFFNIVDDSKDYKGGTLLISKFPIRNTGTVKFTTKTWNSAVFADIDVNGMMIRVFNVHLQSIRFQPKDYRFINSIGDDQEQALAESRSMMQRMRLAYVIRGEQAKLVHEAIGTSPHKVIVCGDFNDTPVSFAYNTIQSGLLDAFVQSGSGFGRTYAGAFPSFRIDYILCHDKFNASGFEILHEKLSDHYPIKAFISIKP